MENIVNVVYLMREAQKEYFATRSTVSLKKAKALEVRVDKMLSKILSGATKHNQLSFDFD